MANAKPNAPANREPNTFVFASLGGFVCKRSVSSCFSFHFPQSRFIEERNSSFGAVTNGSLEGLTNTVRFGVGVTTPASSTISIKRAARLKPMCMYFIRDSVRAFVCTMNSMARFVWKSRPASSLLLRRLSVMALRLRQSGNHFLGALCTGLPKHLTDETQAPDVPCRTPRTSSSSTSNTKQMLAANDRF